MRAPIRLRRPRPYGVPADPFEAADWWAARRALGTLSAREEAAFETWVLDPQNQRAYELAQHVQEKAAAYAAEPEILQMRAAALRARPLASAGRSWGRIAAAAAIGLVVAGGLGWGVWKDSSGDETAVVAEAGDTAPRMQRYETRIGERRDVRLDDGSVISLNTGSLLEVAFNPERRDVRLIRGQALFRVAHNKAWPFVVTAGDRRVTAVGTAFDVRVDPSRLKVVLVEGKVRVDPIRRQGLGKLIPRLAEEDLTPGQQLIAKPGDDEVVVTAADVQRATNWTTGRLIFWDDSLGSAVAELNRYTERRILVDDPRLAALKVSGVFREDRPEDFIAAVTTFYPLKAVQTAPGVTELSWRQPG